MWITFAFLSALFAAITTILAKMGIKNTDSDLATALRTIVVLIFAWIMAFITGGIPDLTTIKGYTLLFLILSGFTTGVSWLCYFKALQLGDVNKVVPIDKSSIVLTMILAFIFLSEQITPLKIICIILIGVGTYMMIEKRQFESKKSDKFGWMFFAFMSAIFAALTTLLGKIGIENIESNLGTAIRTIVVLIFAWAIVLVRGKQKEIKKIDYNSWIFITLSGFATGLSWLCYYHALQDGEASIVAPIDKLSIVFTVVFSFLILKERINAKALMGLGFLVAGTLLLIPQIAERVSMILPLL